MTTGLARSVQARLVQHAKQVGIDPNVVFARYACERLLYRLSASPHAEQWNGFSRRLVADTPAPDLTTVIDVIAKFAGPVLHAVAQDDRSPGTWAPGGPWA
jgi:hypothetical protein